jgi:1,4-dihydroxy-2-naphthoyl-CoA hydrolase
MSDSGIWSTRPAIDFLNGLSDSTMAAHIGLEFTEVGDDFMRAKMPVDHRTVQTFGILHGGASATLAETVGSIAGSFCVDVEKKFVVGLELNCNHVRSVREGYVFATARPIHLGGTTHIWDIRIVDDNDRLVCVSRLTLMVLDQKRDDE